jgi:glycosyltransferase involved in cell wall biosynthesis
VRVLTVGNMYPPHHLGGYELIWESAVARLRDAGHEVRVLTTGFRRSGAGAETDREVRRELRWYWRDHAWPRHGWRTRLELERHNGAVFERNLREFRPESVAWTSMGGMSLSLLERARRGGLPAMAMVCDEWMLYSPDRDAWVAGFRGPLRPLAPIADRLTGIPARVDLASAGPALFMSEVVRSRAAAAWDLPGSRVVHLGADRSAFREAPERPWAWRLLYAGRIDPRKGIDTAVEALSLLPGEASLRVFGGGDDAHLGELRDLAAARGVAERVEFAAGGREQLAAEYAAADLLLFPVRWREPWGLVPLEAMAVGTPVIATGEGGSAEYLRDGENALLFEPGDAAALAATVQRLAEEPRLRARLRAGGLETAARIDDRAFYDAVEELLLEVVEEGI